MPKQQPAEHIAALDWEALQQTLDEQGYAHIPNLLDPEQCHDIINTYEETGNFRSTIHMNTTTRSQYDYIGKHIYLRYYLS
jgi:hypothetical protein